MTSHGAQNAAPLTPEERDQVRRWLQRERDRTLRTTEHSAEAEDELLQRKGERDPCAYLSPTAAQEDVELAAHRHRAHASTQHIREIEEAIRRLDNEAERFGICGLCEGAISMERLEVIPST